MKLIMVLIFLSAMHVSAATYAQNVTISKKRMTLVEVFKLISGQTGYEFLVSPSLLEHSAPVTVNAKNKPVADLLSELLHPQGLDYTMRNNVIIIRRSVASYAPAPVPAALEEAPADVVRGRVFDQTGTPLPGATVMIKGARKGTVTDVNGNFQLSGVSGANVELVITFTGYGVNTVKADFSRQMFIVLKPATSHLDQVQVIAYGTTSKRFNTGNVATVTAADIEKSPVSNPLLALAGRVSGLVINQNTGMPGGAISVRLRGLNSIAKGNDILYIIDGVPYKGGTSGTINSALVQGDLLDLVNPGDIESIDVLKDADATSIYGSRGANGVILITTKKGKPGRTQININAYTGVGKTARTPRFLNLQEYLQMRREAFANDGARPGPLDYDVNGTWDTTRYTDWQKEITDNPAYTNDIQANISGGGSNITYFIGGGYHREKSVLPVDGALQKASTHFSVTGTSNDRRLTVTLGGTYVANRNDITPQDPTFTIRNLAPNAPKPYNDDGSLNWDNGTWDNPYASLQKPYLGKSSNLNANFSAGYNVLKGLNVLLTAGYGKALQDEYMGSPLSIINPFLPGVRNAEAYYRNADYTNWNIEPQVTYDFELGKGRMETLLGATFREQMTENTTLHGVGYVHDALLQNARSANTLTVSDYGLRNNKYNATFGRVRYTWDNKYVLSLNGRYDGSSRFGPDNRFHFFYSLGGIWIFTEEKGVKNALPWLSFGKLRGSYGTSGNDNVGDYSFLDLYNPTGYTYQGDKGLFPGQLFNPVLAWEETRKIEGALELGFLKDRILASASYFTNRSSNQLLPFALSQVTGFSFIERNLPAVVINKGWEFELRTSNIKREDFGWTSSLNLSLPRNELASFPGQEPGDFYYDAIGKPLGSKKVYQFAGVDPQTGSYQFLNSEGKAVAIPDAQTAYIDPTVKYYGGFQNTFTYKNWSLDLLVQFEEHNVTNPILGGVFPVGFMGNQLADIALPRWQKPGDVTDRAKYTQNLFGFLPFALYAKNSTLAYTNVAFARLKNVALAYRLPEKWSNTVRIKQMSVYMHGQNLLTFTKKEFRYFDPETGGLTLPPMKVYTAGIKVNF